MAFGDPEVVRKPGLPNRQLLNDERAGEVVPYVHQEFPKMMYHAVHTPKIVKDKAEMEALGDDWTTTPAGVHAQGREITKRDLELLTERGHPVHNIREAREYIAAMKPEDRAAYYAAVHNAERVAISQQEKPGPVHAADLDLNWDDSHILTPEIYQEDDKVDDSAPAVKKKAKGAR